MAAALVVSKVVSITLDIAVEAVKFSVKQVYDRIVALGLNKKIQDELCRKVKQLEGILKSMKTTAHDTNDKPILQAIEEVNQDLDKCLTACDRIENNPKIKKFWSAIKDSNELKELDSLLAHSLQILNTQLAASIHSNNADRQKESKYLESVARNPQTGCYSLDSKDSSKPEMVQKVSVKEISPGVLRVSWAGITDTRCYEVEYDQQNGQYFRIEQENQECIIDSTKIVFPSKFSYSIRIRGVNGRGPGEWSECVVGKLTILPSPPRKPLLIHVNSSTSVSLVMEKPPEEEGVKPVTHYVVEYHRLEETEHGTQAIEVAIEDLEPLTFSGKEAYKIGLNWNIDTNPMPMYHVKISLRNPDGVSKVYQDDIITGNFQLSDPVKPVDSDPVVFTNTDTIIIKWKKRKTNVYLLDHYEVHWGRNENITKLRKTKNCYAVFRELESRNKYLFKVRAISKMGTKTDFFEINAETDSKAGKVAKAVGAGASVGVGATLLAPFSALYFPVAIAGVVVASDEDIGTKVAASTFGVIGGFTAGILATPVAIAVSPIAGIAAGIVTTIAIKSHYKDKLNGHLNRYPVDEDL